MEQINNTVDHLQWVNQLKRTNSIGTPTHEVTPFVLNDRLYRVENHPRFLDFSVEDPTYRFHEDEIRIRDVETNEILSVPLRNHYFGAGFLHEGRLHIYAGDYGVDLPWRHHKKINWIYSDDLVHWSDPVTVIESEENELLFNTAICRGADRFIMLYETDDARWPPFTFKYCESDDLVHWKRIPGAVYGVDKYVGGPALYYADGWYYTLYVNSPADGFYDTRITRSQDLIHWQDAPEDRPVLPVVPTHIPDPAHPDVFELSASDAELCFWQNKTLVYFHSGNQQGIATLQVAEFDGQPEEFLAHYFDSTLE
jgi:alpha-L-fucosidase